MLASRSRACSSRCLSRRSLSSSWSSAAWALSRSCVAHEVCGQHSQKQHAKEREEGGQVEGVGGGGQREGRFAGAPGECKRDLAAFLPSGSPEKESVSDRSKLKSMSCPRLAGTTNTVTVPRNTKRSATACGAHVHTDAFLGQLLANAGVDHHRLPGLAFSSSERTHVPYTPRSSAFANCCRGRYQLFSHQKKTRHEPDELSYRIQQRKGRKGDPSRL